MCSQRRAGTHFIYRILNPKSLCHVELSVDGVPNSFHCSWRRAGTWAASSCGRSPRSRSWTACSAPPLRWVLTRISHCTYPPAVIVCHHVQAHGPPPDCSYLSIVISPSAPVSPCGCTLQQECFSDIFRSGVLPIQLCGASFSTVFEAHRCGIVCQVSASKKGYKLPRSMLTNSDLTRLINSDEIQSIVQEPKVRAAACC